MGGARRRKNRLRRTSPLLHTPVPSGPVGGKTQIFQVMSQHRSLRAAGSAGGSKRSVLKRFERVAVLKARGQWSEGERITGLRKTKPPE